jgi:dTDP-4-amino-4,6-dideoxygalactose transaminase
MLGAQCSRFEVAFAAWCDVRHRLGVGNATDALEIALRAVGVGAGDAVITVANAGGYATTAILACGARRCTSMSTPRR